MTKAGTKVAGAESWIIPLGVLGLGAFALWKLGLFSGNFLTNSGVSQGNAATSAANQQGTTDTAAQQQAKGEVQTITPVQAASIANQVYTIGQGGSSVDCSAIVNQLVEANNLTDLNAIIKAFGTRSAVTGGGLDCSLLGINCASVDLPTFVRLVLSNSCDDGQMQLQNLNMYLSDTGINFQF